MTRALALALTVLTGFSGLVYEVTWQKLLATLLGSQSEATAATLGLFLGGLSIGYSLFGAVTRCLTERAERTGRASSLLAVYGCVEASIGLWAIAFPKFFQAAQFASVSLPHRADGLGFALDVALSALLLLPPTILMGGTIPILTQSLARRREDATRFHALVYALNTAGAFSGALAAGFWLVPQLGLDGSLFTMGLVNLGVGAVFMLLGLGTQRGTSLASSGDAEVPASFPALATVALLSGFAMMTVQTVLNRIGALAFGASEFTFAMVVAVFVLCIAVGSLVVSALPRIRPFHAVASQWMLVVCLVLLYGLLPNATYGAHVLRTLFRDNDAAFWLFQATAFTAILLVLALPIGLSGALLPLLFHHLRGEVEDLGGVAGRLYSWNTVGSLLGALLGGYALLFVLNLDQVYRIALAALVVSAALLTVRLLAISGTTVILLVAGPLLGGLLLLPRWDPERLAAGLFRVRQPLLYSYTGAASLFSDLYHLQRIVFYHDDPIASVAVRELHGPGSSLFLTREILNNGKSDSSLPAAGLAGLGLGDLPTTVLMAALPAVLADRCEHALVIGYGTGVTAGELASYPETQDVVVSEISPAVLRAGPFFDYGNHGVLHSPKLRVVRGDAYRTLLRSREHFDVIASEPSNPWVTGVEMLYSREFLQAAHNHLAPGGIYVQWFHTYETDQETVDLVMRTYATVFDHVSVWYGHEDDLLLVGFASGERSLDLDQIERRAAQPALVASLRRAGVSGFPALLAHELLPVGVIHAAGLRGDVHTLLHPLLSYRAARAFFRGGSAQLPPSFGPEPAQLGAERSLLRLLAARNGGHLPEEARAEAAQEFCRRRSVECVTFLSAWLHDEPTAAVPHAIMERVRAQPGSDVQAQHLDPDEVAVLFGDGAGGSEGPVSYADALRATNAFTRYYTHAAPFPRTVLRRLWDRCTDREGRCDSGLARTEALVGPLDGSLHPTDSRARSPH